MLERLWPKFGAASHQICRMEPLGFTPRRVSAQLDGSYSYSLADSSSAVSYSWQETSGPTPVVWSDNTAATPTMTGLVFGTYNFSLQVTDVNGSTNTATLQVGAVATDNNGVVINADPNVDKIFGPMIAFGKNPGVLKTPGNITP